MYVSLSVTTYVTRWKDVSRWSRREGSSNLEKRRNAETRSDRMWRSWLSQQCPSWSRDTKHSSSLTLFSVFSVFYLKKDLLKVKRLWVWLCFAQIQLLEMAFRGGLFIVILWVHFRVRWVVFNTSICTPGRTESALVDGGIQLSSRDSSFSICLKANLDNQLMQNETKGGTPEKVMYEWFGHTTLSSSSSDVGRNAGRCLKLVKPVWVDVSVFSVKGIYSKPTRKSKYINWNRSWIITHQLKRIGKVACQHEFHVLSGDAAEDVLASCHCWLISRHRKNTKCK